MAFSDITGQKNAIEFIKNSIRQNRVASAYLFGGPEGVGKFLTAKNFAKALNCMQPNQYDCCDKCASCVRIDSNNHPDVLTIEPVGTSRQIKIEQIRQLIGKINLKPYEAKTKFFMINNAHFMNDEASNCLLKTLEEPPVNSVLILITSNKNQLFPTIISRCQIIRFFYLGMKEIQDILLQQYKMDALGACYFSHLSGGSLADISALKDINILDYKNEVIDNFINQPEQFLFQQSPIYDAQKMQRDLRILLGWYRDILIFKVTQQDASVANTDRVKQISQQAATISEKELITLIERIEYAQRLVRSNLNIDIKLILQNLINDICYTGVHR